MRFAISQALFLLLVISACQSNSGLSGLQKGSRLAPGVLYSGDSVDGLIVGHRLMASGEYELALRAYTRAINEQGLNADVLSAIGSANLKLGRLNQAQKYLQAAVEKDSEFVPAWNNLGVVLSGLGKDQEARRVFQLAFGLDGGNSEEIRTNLTKAIAKIENSGYVEPEQQEFELVRRGNGRYLLLQTPNSTAEQ